MMTREQLDGLLIIVHLGTKEARTNAIAQINAHDAILRQQLETSMRTQETLAKNVNDGLLDIRDLHQQLEAEKAEVYLQKQKVIEVQAEQASLIHQLSTELAAVREERDKAVKVQQDYDAWLKDGVYYTDEEFDRHIAEHRQQLADLHAKCEQLKQEVHYLKDGRN